MLSSTRTSYFGSGQEVCGGVCDQEGATKAALTMRMAHAAMRLIPTVARPCSARSRHPSIYTKRLEISRKRTKSVPDCCSIYSNARPDGVLVIFLVQSIPSSE